MYLRRKRKQKVIHRQDAKSAKKNVRL